MDYNGDGSYADRPVAGEGREFALPGERGILSISLVKHSWRQGAAPRPAFGQPLGGMNDVDPGREFQFELRVVF